MKIKAKSLLIAFCVMTLALAGAFTSYAAKSDEPKDYKIYDAWWEDSFDNIQKACWDKPEDSTSYKFKLMRGSKVVQSWKSVSGTSYNCNALIAKNGTGDYTFYVYPVKGGEEMAVKSDTLEVDSELLKLIKQEQKDLAAYNDQLERADGWHAYPDGRWKYGKGNYKLARNEFLTINGVTYHFDTSEFMDTGWKCLNNKWYYFDGSGAMLRNTITPDGYLVNGDGVWINADGSIATTTSTSTSNYQSAYSSTRVVAVNFEESDEVGVIKHASIKEVTNCVLVSSSWSVGYESWSVGTPIVVTVVVRPKDGYAFNSNTTFSSNIGKVISVTGNDNRTIKVNYFPRKKLNAPQSVYFGNDDCIKWTKVDSAKEYKIKFYNGGTYINSRTTEDTLYNINEYDEYGDLNVVVSAIGKNKYYIESDGTRLNGVTDMYSHSTGLGGEFGRSDKGLYYKDGGDKVKGWQYLGGYWYHFNNSGYADGPGWFWDSDGNWYYMNANYQMVTGTVNDGGVNYFLNDGSYSNFPFGAWVH